ncbi:MAG TPA: cation-translocating P-type ATPase, partial [Nitrospira sp.]
MTVTHLYVDGRGYDVTGEGYVPEGDIIGGDPSAGGLRDLLLCALLCNGASLKAMKGSWTVVGDPTEGALFVVAGKAGLRKEDVDRVYPLVEEIPFDPARKMMTMMRRSHGAVMAYVKGAPDVLLSQCA